MQPNITKIAGLISDPSRSLILLALMGGKAFTATELALEAGITAQTASSHLSKLVDGGLLIVRRQGRHKYFQLRDYEVALVIENLLTISPESSGSNLATGPKDLALRAARVCYDHLAGSTGVALFNTLVENRVIAESDGVSILTDSGRTYFESLGVNFEELTLATSKRPLCKSCLDWSERRSHLGGVLGKWILDDVLSNGWASQGHHSRAISFTNSGQKNFDLKYKIS